MLLAMMLYPSIQIIMLSMSDITLPTFDLRFSGLRNFIRSIRSPDFLKMLLNTVTWVGGTVFFEFLVGFGAALTMNTERRGIKIFQALALMPWTVPQIVSANTWLWIFQTDYGLLNVALRSIGLGRWALPWLGDGTTALWAVMVGAIWHSFPFIMLMLLAGLKSIPEEQYEAGRVDGATRFQRFLYITLPNLKGIIFITCMLQLIWALNTFDLIFVMTGGGPGGSTEVFGLFIYRLGFQDFDFGAAAAMGVMLLVLALLFLVCYLVIPRRNRTVT